MLMKKPVGQNGASRKYDLLSVLGAHGLAGGKAGQRLTLRLICLITARYNWQADELSVGQGEIARLWSVDLRTVKREMAVLRTKGWLVEKRGAARGRVTLYGLGIGRILSDTQGDWGQVGSDLVARLTGQKAVDMPSHGNVVPFAPIGAAEGDPSLWGRALGLLQAENATAFAAWIAGLEMIAADGGQIVLRAPSAFHASYVATHLSGGILAALRRVDPMVVTVRVTG